MTEELSTWHNYDFFSNSIPWYRKPRDGNVRDVPTGVSSWNGVKGTRGLGRVSNLFEVVPLVSITLQSCIDITQKSEKAIPFVFVQKM